MTSPFLLDYFASIHRKGNGTSQKDRQYDHVVWSDNDYFRSVVTPVVGSTIHFKYCLSSFTFISGIFLNHLAFVGYNFNTAF